MIFVEHDCFTSYFDIIILDTRLALSKLKFLLKNKWAKLCFPSGFFDEMLDKDTHRLVEHSSSLSSTPFMLKIFYNIYYRIDELNFFNFQIRKEDSVNLHFESSLNGQKLVVPIKFS